MDHDGVPVGDDDRHAHLRQVRRCAGAAPAVHRRHRHLHTRIDRLRFRRRLLDLRRLSGRPRTRWRRADDPLAGDHRRYRARIRARQVSRPARRDLRSRGSRRPPVGRVLRRSPQLAMGVLHQYPDRHRRTDHRHRRAAPARQEGHETDRRGGCPVPVGCHDVPHLLHRLRRLGRVRLGLLVDLGVGCRFPPGCRTVRVHRVARRGPDHASRDVPQTDLHQRDRDRTDAGSGDVRDSYRHFCRCLPAPRLPHPAC